jgi:hypothetical protein
MRTSPTKMSASASNPWGPTPPARSPSTWLIWSPQAPEGLFADPWVLLGGDRLAGWTGVDLRHEGDLTPLLAGPRSSQQAHRGANWSDRDAGLCKRSIVRVDSVRAWPGGRTRAAEIRGGVAAALPRDPAAPVARVGRLRSASLDALAAGRDANAGRACIGRSRSCTLFCPLCIRR